MSITKLSWTSHKYDRILVLMGAIVAGILIPQAAAYSNLIQYFLFGMLFLAFVGMEFDPKVLHPNLLSVLIANVGLGLAAYFVLRRVDNTLALAGFMTGISPTAISSPVVNGLLQRRVDFTIAAVLLTNISIALLIPFLLPALVGNQVPISILDVLWSVMKIVVFPLILARLVHYLPERVQKPFFKAKGVTFLLWVSSLFIIVSKASQFIRDNSEIPLTLLLEIAVISLILCVINFSLGALISGPEFQRETSQVLGQKNLSFTIWLSLTFINPIVALGPAFYILFHNIYNSFQLYQFEKQKLHSQP